MKCIVVGTDRSEAAVAATRWALDLARRTGASVELVEAFRTISAETSPDDLEEQAAEQLALIDRWSREHALAPATSHAVAGPPVPVLVGEAVGRRADLVVIGSDGAAGFTKLGLGSTAHGLAGELAMPLVIVPSTSGDHVGDGPVVIGLDGSDGNSIALEWTERLAKALGTEVAAVHAPKGDDVAADLFAAAEQRDAALVVVGARDRNSLGGAIIGRVADEMIHDPARPTAVITHGYQQRCRDAGNETPV
ncbi:MAG: universal stress protein [Acidimicrobiia bacterium]